MADQKSRGGQKQTHEKDPQGKEHQGNIVTNKPGDAPEAQKELRGRDHMTDPMPSEGGE